MARRVVVWFRNDLRVHDNAILHAAAQSIQNNAADEVLPCYCLDPRHFQLTEHNSPKTHLFRARFLLESVNNLKQQLRSIGSDLLVVVGKPEEVIPELQPQHVLASEEPTWEEAQVARRLSRRLPRGANLETLWQYSLFHMDDIPYSRPDLNNFPDGFTSFRNKVENGNHCAVRALLPAPKAGALPLPSSLPDGIDFIPTVDDLPLPEAVHEQYATAAACEHEARKDASMPTFKGGESAALERLDCYLWKSDLLSTYFDTRNGMLGGDYSTKLSSWLAHGCISPRMIHSECQRYEQERVCNKSTYWVTFELLWRDFLRFFCVKHGNRVFLVGGAKSVSKAWTNDANAVERWKSGNTGMPLVDANMRELAATGFQSNRGRQNVASYLTLDLQIDWRIGADHFESLLIDHDVSSNYGNWNAAAGLTGGRVNKFNITKQSRDYDAEGHYIRTWVPELENVPLAHLFEPWKMPKGVQQTCGCVIGEDYPAPIQAVAQPQRRELNPNKQRKPPRVQNNREREWKQTRKNAARKGEFDMYG